MIQNDNTPAVAGCFLDFETVKTNAETEQIHLISGQGYAFKIASSFC